MSESFGFTRASNEQFFARIAPWQQFLQLFDHIDGVTFFLKDRSGRFMAFGSGALRCLDFGFADDLLGQTDYDLYPKRIADLISADDQKVFDSGSPLLNHIEMLVNPRFAVIGWYVTNKIPVLDNSGQIIGIAGTVQPYEVRRDLMLSGTSLDAVIERIRERPQDEHPLEELAAQAGLSTRQLGRKFHEFLGLPPRDFHLKCRIVHACRELTHTDHSVTQIALDCGFFDQSAFARQFRRIIGMAPLGFRKRYLSSSRAATAANLAGNNV